MTTSRREHLVVQTRHAARGLRVVARSHGFVIDEAERYGGHDEGANPVEHMIAGLAAASLVVLRVMGEGGIADASSLTVSATLNVDRVMGVDDAAVFERFALDWTVQSEEHAERLRAALPELARRRPGQAVIDGAESFVERVTVGGPADGVPA